MKIMKISDRTRDPGWVMFLATGTTLGADAAAGHPGMADWPSWRCSRPTGLDVPSQNVLSAGMPVFTVDETGLTGETFGL